MYGVTWKILKNYVTLILAILFLSVVCFDQQTRGLHSQMPFPGNRICLEKIREISCHEHSLPSPDTVPAFGTGFFCLVSGRETFGNSRCASRMKINNFNFGIWQDFPNGYPFVNQIQHLPRLSGRVPFLI